jgi:hypothetical protein
MVFVPGLSGVNVLAVREMYGGLVTDDHRMAPG